MSERRGYATGEGGLGPEFPQGIAPATDQLCAAGKGLDLSVHQRPHL